MILQQLPRRFSVSTNAPASILVSSCRSILLSSSSSSSSLLINNNHSNSHSKRYYHNTPFRSNSNNDRHGTTIVCVRKNGSVCMMGDGMVSQGSMIVKPNALKLRRIVAKTAGMNEKVATDDDSTTNNNAASDKYTTIVGFAGSTADAFTLLERLESKLDEYPGQLARSCVELAKGWRTDKYLRRLEASLIVADITCSLEITGNGDVLESHDGVLGVGSGSPYAIAAARALMDIPELSAEDVAKKAMRVASDMCVYTNDNYRIEVLQTGSNEISSSTTTTTTAPESPTADLVESKK